MMAEASTDRRRGYPRGQAVATRALVGQHFRLMLKEPVPLVMFFLFPALVMGFLQEPARITLSDAGFREVSGAEQAVPGVSVMFAMLLMTNVGFTFFREHAWGTWERLQAATSPTAVFLGKCGGPLLVSIFQFVFLFGIGITLLDLDLGGADSALAVGAIGVASSLCFVGLGVLLVGITRTFSEMNSLASLLALLMAGAGSALSPTSAIPGWVATAGAFTPAGWAMRAYRDVLLNGAGLTDVLGWVALLATTGTCLMSLGVRARPDLIRTV